MFDKNPEDRLRAWAEFRNSLETTENPIKDTLELYAKAPLVNIQVDPYDRETWLDPWQLLNENKYCNFAILLGILYTLQLTTRFSYTPAEIHISTNEETSEVFYLLHFDNLVIGYHGLNAIDKAELPDNLSIETVYSLPAMQ